MSALVKAFGRTLRAERSHRRWSQERLAEQAGLDRSYVSELERGAASPSLPTLEKLALAFELRASQLIGLSETQKLD